MSMTQQVSCSAAPSLRVQPLMFWMVSFLEIMKEKHSTRLGISQRRRQFRSPSTRTVAIYEKRLPEKASRAEHLVSVIRHSLTAAVSSMRNRSSQLACSATGERTRQWESSTNRSTALLGYWKMTSLRIARSANYRWYANLCWCRYRGKRLSLYAHKKFVPV